MSFENDLQEAIQMALDERKQEEAGRYAFDSGWENLRREMVLPVLESAAKIISTKLRGSQAQNDNGGVVLEVVWTEKQRRFEHALRFSPDREKREVICSSSLPGDGAERFTLENLTETAVEMKVKQFAYTLARG